MNCVICKNGTLRANEQSVYCTNCNFEILRNIKNFKRVLSDRDIKDLLSYKPLKDIAGTILLFDETNANFINLILPPKI